MAVGTLAEKIFGVHQLAAAATGAAIFAVSHEQAKTLAEAVTEVAVHYNLKDVLDSKQAAIINLAIVAGMIYVPKVIMIRGVIVQARREVNQNAAAAPSPYEQDNEIRTPGETMVTPTSGVLRFG